MPKVLVAQNKNKNKNCPMTIALGRNTQNSRCRLEITGEVMGDTKKQGRESVARENLSSYISQLIHLSRSRGA